MQNGTMTGGAMMWGMGWLGLLVLVLLTPGIAALVKYLLRSSRWPNGFCSWNRAGRSGVAPDCAISAPGCVGMSSGTRCIERAGV